MISKFYELKGKCDSLGSEYQEYFSKEWEQCHNSQNSDFCYIDRFEAELADVKLNYDRLKAEEEKYITESKDLEQRVIKALENHPYILQTDLYKMFNPVVQKDIQSIIYFMAKNGTISIDKSGRSYQIQYLK